MSEHERELDRLDRVDSDQRGGLINSHRRRMEKVYAAHKMENERRAVERQARLDDETVDLAERWTRELERAYKQGPFMLDERGYQDSGARLDAGQVARVVAARLRGKINDRVAPGEAAYTLYISHLPVDREAGESHWMLWLHHPVREPDGSRIARLRYYASVGAARGQRTRLLNEFRQDTVKGDDPAPGTVWVLRVEAEQTQVIGVSGDVLASAAI